MSKDKSKKTALKAGKTSKQLTTTTAPRSSRIAKHTRKLEKLKNTGLKPTKISYGVRVIVQNAPVDIAGVVIEKNDVSLVVHHTKSKSSKEVVTHIPLSKVIEYTGDVGVPSLIRYFGDSVVTEIKSASVVTNGNEFIVTDLLTGDVSHVYQSPNVRIELSGAAEEVAAESSAKRKFKK